MKEHDLHNALFALDDVQDRIATLKDALEKVGKSLATLQDYLESLL